ncbi:MAG: stage IV sporulation protein A [Clostridia bacterium]|nr:stage IV sporulation protein A [Clostridia bacterium]
MKANTSIYQDISARTNGDIYLGVVGPVRTGKSTFIKRFMEKLVLPQMEEGSAKERAKDEMPQSGSGKIVMTTEPKFVPEDAVRIQIDDGLGFRVKLVDCVGFTVPEASGLTDEGSFRMVNTPWSKSPLPFPEAARLGTEKVIREHSTIGVVVTTDGSFGQIPRSSYPGAEEEVINAMKETGKPFVILLNSQHPEEEETQNLATFLQEKHKVPVLAKNCFAMEENDFLDVLGKIVLEFPLREIRVQLPTWLLSLPEDQDEKKSILNAVCHTIEGLQKTGEYFTALEELRSIEGIQQIKPLVSDLGTGRINLGMDTDESLYWKILSEGSGIEIRSKEEMLKVFCTLAQKKLQLDRLESALRDVEENGYGIVPPSLEEMKLEEPKIVKQAGGYGVKLKASAPSIHMIRANIEAEISPIVGSERQSEDIVKFLLEEFTEDPTKIWDSNLFGKSLYELVNEGLNTKLNHMPADARLKLSETLQKIINDGSSGLICIIL